MSSSVKSSVTSTLKPRNIFYVWYTELCRRSNTNPLSIVKPAKPKNDVVLEFTADRIKCEEWTPILQALSLDTSLHVISIRSRITQYNFNYDINTEEKAQKMKKPCPVLWTDYIIKFLTKSLGCCLRNSQVLSSLELDGIPIHIEYLETLLQNLRYSRSIKTLSFKRCQIKDAGCQMICASLRLMPNIAVLNLTACNLTTISARCIAKIIQHQQINRYSESWHNSLRYEEPDSDAMGGIKRITLNSNPGIGDDGLELILGALDDDLWIKAIDMRNCNITENMSKRILQLVEQNTNLEVADFRNNDSLNSGTMERLLEVFEKKYRMGSNPEFQWGESNSSICGTNNTCSSISGINGTVQRTRSATLRNFGSIELTPSKGQLRRTRTQVMSYNFIENINSKQSTSTTNKVSALQAKLKVEISKRLETEKINNELQRQLLSMQKIDYLHHDRFLTPEKITKVVRIFEDTKYDDSQQPIVNNKEHTRKHLVKSNEDVNKKVVETKSSKTIFVPKVIKPAEKKSVHNVIKEPISKKSVCRQSKHKKITKIMSPIYETTPRQNPVEDITTTAQNLFAQLLLQTNYKNCIEENIDCNGTILQYCCETDFADNGSSADTMSEDLVWQDQKRELSSGSDTSLETLYRELEAVGQELNLNSMSTFNVF